MISALAMTIEARPRARGAYRSPISEKPRINTPAEHRPARQRAKNRVTNCELHPVSANATGISATTMPSSLAREKRSARIPSGTEHRVIGNAIAAP